MSRAEFTGSASSWGEAAASRAMRPQGPVGTGRSGMLAGNALYSEVQADVVAFIENGSRGSGNGGASRGTGSVGSASSTMASSGAGSGAGAAWGGASAFASMAPSSWPWGVPRASAPGAAGGSTSTSGGASTWNASSALSAGRPSAGVDGGVGSGGTGVSAQAQRDFLDRIEPLARQAGERLGVAPDLVAAQAALESGWGRRPLRRADGSDANNLFGLKGGGAWAGEVTHAATHEQAGDEAVPRVEPFRSYGDASAGFDDYASLLASSPRYRSALGAGSDARVFANALAQGGYASDPAYADKLMRVASQVRAMREAGQPAGADAAVASSSRRAADVGSGR